MERFAVEVTIQEEGVPQALYACGAPRLLVGLGLTGGGTCRMHFGSRTAELLFAPEPALPPDRLDLSPDLAAALGLDAPIGLTANRTGHREVTLGPLVGLLMPPAKLTRMLAGKLNRACCRHARHAREAGITLVFFSPAEVDLEAKTVLGYTHRCDGVHHCRWTPRRYPLPRVIYDRCNEDPAPARSPDPEASALAQATYLGKPFGVRSLVQRDGSGNWAVTGLAARIGELAAPVDRVFRHAFPERWATVLAELERISLMQAPRSEAEQSPRVEVGLNLSVTPDGMVKLIEATDNPLRATLDRLKDPLISERIDRCPIHAAASIDLRGGWRPPHGPAEEGPPLVGVLLGDSPLRLLHGRLEERFRQMVRAAADAGAAVFFFEADEVDLRDGLVRGWVEAGGLWRPGTLPLPDVIYNRAVCRNRILTRQMLELLRALAAQHGTALINSANAISKAQVNETLALFPDTACLSPQTVRFTTQEALVAMLDRHACLYIKAERSINGSELLQITQRAGQWLVDGRVGCLRIQKTFGDLPQLQAFLLHLKGGDDWIVQQSIGLPVMEVRALAQKTGTGEWTVPLVVARSGRQSAGLGAKAGAAATAAVAAAEALECKFGLLGELGVDIGLDRQGRPWVFGANTKPIHPQLPDLPEPLVCNPFRYALWLANRARQGRRTDLPAPVRLT